MKFVLAPLAEFTDAPFRLVCRENGADLAYTEMVSAAGLAHGSSPTRHLMEVMDGEGPVACQIFGARETDVASAAREVEKIRDRFVELNLNAGCPMAKVTREGAGAKLAENPAKVFSLLKTMAENTSLPITLKTRLGPHPQCTTIFELLDAAQQAGAKGLAVHARYTSQMHGGPVRLDLLADVVARAHIPVIGNGSVVDARTASEMAKTGVEALMIGRAALARPWIFQELKGGSFKGVPSPIRHHLDLILRFRRQLVERYPNDHVPGEDAYASVKMHTHLFRYFNGRPGAAKLRATLNAVRTLREIYDIIEENEHEF